MDFLTLDMKGVAAAIFIGIGLFILGGALGIFFILAMLVFLVLSAIVTQIGAAYKKRKGLGQEPRSIKNVLANGLPPLIFAAAFYLSSKYGYSGIALFVLMGFIASVAAITADKFSSELGVLNGKPRMIFMLDEVEKGTSGGVTALGTFAGLAGAFIIALLVFTVLPSLSLIGSFSLKRSMLAVIAAGFAGSFIDTILGYYEEKGIGNKFTSNFVCGVAGGILAIILLAVF